MHNGFLLNDDGSTDRRVIEKRLRHFSRNANTSVRRRVGWNVALMHRVTASEKHRKRHARPIVMRTGRPRILARVDIGFQDVAEIVHIIAEDSGDVVRVFRQDGVMARRSAEPGFAGRDRRFSDEMFAFVEIRVLLRNAHNDLR